MLSLRVTHLMDLSFSVLAFRFLFGICQLFVFVSVFFVSFIVLTCSLFFCGSLILEIVWTLMFFFLRLVGVFLSVSVALCLRSVLLRSCDDFSVLLFQFSLFDLFRFLVVNVSHRPRLLARLCCSLRGTEWTTQSNTHEIVILCGSIFL